MTALCDMDLPEPGGDFVQIIFTCQYKMLETVKLTVESPSETRAQTVQYIYFRLFVNFYNLMLPSAGES